MADRPLQRLHRAQASAHHGGELRDAEMFRETRLGGDPVLDGDDRKAAAPRLARARIGAARTGRAVAAAEIVHADHEEAAGIDRLAGADHVVPPADVLRVVRVPAGDVVRSVERVTDQHRVRAVRVQRAVGLVRELVLVDHRTALQLQRLGEARDARRDDADRLTLRCGSDYAVHK
jgi:hypothetical protein